MPRCQDAKILPPFRKRHEFAVISPVAGLKRADHPAAKATRYPPVEPNKYLHYHTPLFQYDNLVQGKGSLVQRGA